jgi:hypothetical protein
MRVFELINKGAFIMIIVLKMIKQKQQLKN